jgi:hypothetical protein
MENSTYNYDEQDPTFVADLLESADYVWIVAKWMSQLGYDVRIPATKIRPSATEMAKYADNGDLFITKNGAEKRIEVKRRPDLHFQEPKDFPYPTIIVDAAHCFDNAVPKPDTYVILNSKATHAITISVASTRNLWQLTQKYDRFKKRNRLFYECPMLHTLLIPVFSQI